MCGNTVKIFSLHLCRALTSKQWTYPSWCKWFSTRFWVCCLSPMGYNIACFPWMSQFNCYHLQLVYLTMEHHPLRNLWHKTVQTTLETFDESQHLCTMHSIFFFLPYICSFIFLEKMKHAAAAAAAKSLQSCLTLCDPRDGSPPGSPVPGILQARTLEWVAISFSNAWKWKVKVKSLSHVWLLATPWTAAYQAPPSMGFSRQEYWSGVPLPSPMIKHDTL